MQRPHREIVRGPRPDPVERDRCLDEVVEVDDTVESQRASRDRSRETADRRGSCLRQADTRDRIDSGSRDDRCRRKSIGESGLRIARGASIDAAIDAAIDRRSERSSESTRERRCCGDGDLLTEHRADRCFEAVDRAGYAQPRPASDERTEQGSRPSTAPMTSGRASRSNSRRTRATSGISTPRAPVRRAAAVQVGGHRESHLDDAGRVARFRRRADTRSHRLARHQGSPAPTESAELVPVERRAIVEA